MPKKGAAMEKLQCCHRNMGVSESTKQVRIMVLKGENCNESYNSLTEIRRMLREFCYFQCHEVATYEESFSLATISEP